MKVTNPKIGDKVKLSDGIYEIEDVFKQMLMDNVTVCIIKNVEDGKVKNVTSSWLFVYGEVYNG